jgi:hypothetical protein
MNALAGQESPFDHGREQMKLLAGLEVTTKAVERTAEAIGENIAAREQEQIQRAMQLDLPTIVGEPVPILYVQMDGTGVPVVKKETVGCPGKTDGQPAHTRGSEVGMCIHPNRLGPRGLPDPRSGFHHLYGSHRERGRVWPSPLCGSLETRPESGAEESRPRTVTASRLKRSALFWTVRGAKAILALRSCHLNGHFEDYWEARRAD